MRLESMPIDVNTLDMHAVVSTKQNDSIRPLEGVREDVHCTFMCRSPNVETTQMPINRRMDKLWCIHTMEYDLAIEKRTNCMYC